MNVHTHTHTHAQVKPLLAMWRTEEEMRKKNEKIDKLKGQTERLEAERTMFKQTERVLEEKVGVVNLPEGDNCL